MTGEEIKRERLRLGMTRQKLAAAAFTAETAIYKIEAGMVRKPHRGTLEHIKNALEAERIRQGE